jgi:hypothetical protein
MADKKQVKLLRNVSKMTADNRIRYYLGLPQDYPVNPKLAKKAESKILKRLGSVGLFGGGHGVEGSYKNKPTPLESALLEDLSGATRSIERDKSRAASGKVTPAHYTGLTSLDYGFRNVDEGVAKARKRVAKERLRLKKDPKGALAETP